MYYYIQGKLVHKSPTIAVIDVGGIGYEIRIPLSVYSKIGNQEECKLFTYLYVKEDVQQLYGFFEKSEKELFLMLISISGIGPSTGLAFLSSMSALEIKTAILSDDVKMVQSVKGVGAKTAQRVVIELKDKIAKLEIEGEGDLAVGIVAASSFGPVEEEALEALVALGFTRTVAQRTIRSIIKKFGKDLSVEDLIKLALKNN